MYYLKKFEQILKSKNNKKQKLFILSASIITLVASGGSGKNPPASKDGLTSSGDVTGDVSKGNDNVKLGEKSGASGIVDTGAGDDIVVGGDAVDTIRGGAGVDHVQGGAGVDNLILIGQTNGAGYTLSDLQNPNGTGVDLTNLLELDDVNNNAVSDATSGDVIDGGADGAFLFIYGNVDLTGVTLINITRIDVHSEVTIPAATLKFLIDSGILKQIIGDGSTELIITNNGVAIEVDLSAINMAGVNHLTLGSNVTLVVDAADIADNTIIDGEGTIKAASGQLDLDGKTIAETIDILDSDGNVITPEAEVNSIGASVSIAENSTSVGTFSVTDASSVGDVTYSLSGEDAAAFNINAITGEITFAVAPNFESPSDNGNDGTYDIIVTATDQHGKSLNQAVVVDVTNANDAPTGSVSIIGTAAEGQTLVATNDIADEDGLGAITYQWQRDGSDIGGATANFYTLVQADVAAEITVVASYTDGGATNESVISAATSVVINVNNAPTGSVSVAGTPTEGETLTASNNLADTDGLGVISYQWQRDGQDIGRASDATYTLVQDDVGKAISVVASYTDGGGADESVTSAAISNVANVNDVPTGGVYISGVVAEYETLTVSNNLADEDGLGAISYQWQRGGNDINGATNDTYTLAQIDVGKIISVVASYTDGFGANETSSVSTPTSVLNVNNNPTGSVTISGTITEGQTLTASNNLADEDGVGVITYQWYRDGGSINGATNSTHILVQDDVDRSMTVKASYTDGDNFLEVVTSAGTLSIANVNDAPTGGVSISGTEKSGQTLTAINNIADEDGVGTLHYQWKSDGVAIANSDNSQYILRRDDVGNEITVEVTYTDGYGFAESVTSGVTNTIKGYATLALNNNIDGVNGSSFIASELSSFQFSTKVSGIGDVNNDGLDDFAFSAPMSGFGGTVFVVYGANNGYGIEMDMANLNGSNGFQIDGVDFGDHIGFDIAAAGDVNNDGFDDILISSTDSDYAGTNTGSAYVVFGKATSNAATLDLNDINGTNGFRVDGEASNVDFGYSVASAGDINNDGFDDIIVGAYSSNYTGNVGSGATYIVFGKAAGFTSVMNVNSLNGTNGFRLVDGSIYEGLGYSVSGLGDINGDGFDDIIIGAASARSNSNNASGSSYVLFGKSTGFTNNLDLTTMTASDGFKFDGTYIFDSSGWSVSSAGDVNGDGLADIIIGAVGTDFNGSQSGSAYVIFGKASGYVFNNDLSDLNGTDGFRIDGTGNPISNVAGYGNRIGEVVRSAGDINGDGFDDLIVGSVGGDYNGTKSGSVYIIYGKAGDFAATMQTSELDGSNGFRIDGPEANGQLGRTVSAAGDVNNDGYDDLLFGSDAIGGSGKGYILYGGEHFNAPIQTASAFDDTLNGTIGADTIDGLDGNDIIYGLAGADNLSGGVGEDRLKGGVDADILVGGADFDTFVFAPGDSKITIGGSGDNGTVSGYDTIQDYTTNQSNFDSEIIDFVGIAATAVDTAGTDGIDSLLTVDGATIKSHSISNGIITFDDDDTFTTALDISTEGEYAAVLQYLQSQTSSYQGESMVFNIGADNILFIQGEKFGNDDDDVVILFENTQIDSLINSDDFGSFDLFVV